MGEVTTTIYEVYVQRLLQFLDVPFFAQHVLCFECGAHFPFSSDKIPSCPIGLHEMPKGTWSRPDIIISDKRGPMPLQSHTEDFTPCAFSILRIDGGIHDKRRVIKRDKAQEREMKRLNIPFFISDNEFWQWEVKGKMVAPDPYRLNYQKIPRIHLDYLLSLWAQTVDNSLYQKYQKIKEVSDSKF